MPVPRAVDTDSWRHDHDGIQEATPSEMEAREHQCQSLGRHQRRPSPQLALHDAHLLAEGDDLTVTVVSQQTTNQHVQRREKQQKHMVEHAARMTAAPTRSQVSVAGGQALAPQGMCDGFWDPTGVRPA